MTAMLRPLLMVDTVTSSKPHLAVSKPGAVHHNRVYRCSYRARSCIGRHSKHTGVAPTDLMRPIRNLLSQTLGVVLSEACQSDQIGSKAA
jgi:hypothetical protein